MLALRFLRLGYERRVLFHHLVEFRPEWVYFLFEWLEFLFALWDHRAVFRRLRVSVHVLR